MNNEILDEELSQMYEEEKQVRVLDSGTVLHPVRNLRVRKPITLSQEKTVADALAVMQAKRIGCVLVTRNAKLVGVFTERDVLFKVAGTTGMERKALQDVMTANVETLHPDDTIAHALNVMHLGGFRHVPIVDDQRRPLAVVSIKDLVTFIVEHFPQEVLNLPPKPIRKTEQREGA